MDLHKPTKPPPVKAASSFRFVPMRADDAQYPPMQPSNTKKRVFQLVHQGSSSSGAESSDRASEASLSRPASSAASVDEHCDMRRADQSRPIRITLASPSPTLQIPPTAVAAMPVFVNTSELLYVNPKQYDRILARRQQRLQMEADGRISNTRRKYLYESRHKHALARGRGEGGKFAVGKRKEIASDEEDDDEEETRTEQRRAPLRTLAPRPPEMPAPCMPTRPLNESYAFTENGTPCGSDREEA